MSYIFFLFIHDNLGRKFSLLHPLSFPFQCVTEKHQTNPISLLLSSREEAGEVRHKQFLHVPVTDRFATLSSNVFPSCTIQNNCGNFFNLDSRLSKAGRRLGPVYISGGGGPQVSEVTCLGRVIRLSLQPLIWSPHLSCKLDQIKMREYMDRGVINYTREQVLNCVLEVVQYICIIICNQPLLFWLLLFSHFIIFFFSEKEKTVI